MNLRDCLDELIWTPDKINFSPKKAAQIDALHERVAGRLKWIVDTNQGLYIKLGQELGAIHPPPPLSPLLLATSSQIPDARIASGPPAETIPRGLRTRLRPSPLGAVSRGRRGPSPV